MSMFMSIFILLLISILTNQSILPVVIALLLNLHFMLLLAGLILVMRTDVIMSVSIVIVNLAIILTIARNFILFSYQLKTVKQNTKCPKLLRRFVTCQRMIRCWLKTGRRIG